MCYYFIIFMYGASEKTIQNDVTDEHPFEWEKSSNKLYPKQYKLIDWREISKEEYETYKMINK
jgi:hypothetical protein